MNQLGMNAINYMKKEHEVWSRNCSEEFHEQKEMTLKRLNISSYEYTSPIMLGSHSYDLI